MTNPSLESHRQLYPVIAIQPVASNKTISERKNAKIDAQIDLIAGNLFE